MLSNRLVTVLIITLAAATTSLVIPFLQINRNLDLNRNCKDFLKNTAATLACVLCLESTFIDYCTASDSISLSNKEFVDEKGSFSFRYSSDLLLSPKPLRTHNMEVYFKSEDVKGFNVGLTVDPVKIDNIEDFTTPEGLGQKVASVERSKDGVFEVDVIKTSSSVITIPTTSTNTISLPVYDIEYKIDSSRGKNHYKVRALVNKKNLFVFTAQTKEDDFNSLENKINDILNSLSLKDI